MKCPLIYFLLGPALARFEPSTSPEHAGRRVVHLRIVKLVRPVTSRIMGYSGGFPKPEEGQLLVRDGALTPWAYDLDIESVAATAFRVLWDNAQNTRKRR
jgi:hypothetical protein